MIVPNLVQLKADQPSQGLYESYYFRGNSQDGKLSFWLKHNLLRFNDSPSVLVENMMILFSREKKRTKVYHKSATLDAEAYAKSRFSKPGDWDSCELKFDDGSFFSIHRDRLKGEIRDAQGMVRWELALKRSDEAYHHFSRDWFYHGFFPKKKILTRDIALEFGGTIIENQEAPVARSFIGMNGHNWGREHAFSYAYANCNEWDDGSNAYFDGFSAKIIVAGMKSPYLSLASLKCDGQWHHFNNVATSYRPRVSELTDDTWAATFANATHKLDLRLDGREALWATLEYAHPSRKVSIVRNTKFARGALKLTELGSGQLVRELTTRLCELETIAPKA